jgi:hypothetical protein
MHRVPPAPQFPKIGAGEHCYVVYAKKLYMRRESLRRCGYQRNPNTVDLWFCCKHSFEINTESLNVEIPKEDGTMKTRLHWFSFNAPKPEGTKSLFLLPANKDNRGCALPRRKIVEAEALLEGTKKSGAQGELASANLARWQDCAEEETATQADLKKTDRLLLHALGRDVHLQASSSRKEIRKIFDDGKRKSPKVLAKDKSIRWWSLHGYGQEKCRQGLVSRMSSCCWLMLLFVVMAIMSTSKQLPQPC